MKAPQRLSALGLLQFETNRGATVPKLSVAQAVENSVLRKSIEVEMLRHAVPRQSIVDLAEAELALSNSAMGVTESNWAFHRALYQAAGWQRGLAIVEILHAAVAPYVLLYLESSGGAEQAQTEHLALLDACRDGNADAAIALLESHLSDASTAVIDFLGATQSIDEPRDD